MYKITLTKHSMEETQDKMFSIIVWMTVTDGPTDVFSMILPIEYDANVQTIDDIKEILLQKAKDAWNDNLRSQANFDSSSFDGALGDTEKDWETWQKKEII